MKSSYLISLAVATALFSGCGSSSSSTVPETLTPTTTITVERGPILKAMVVDANGQQAKEDGNGKYTFTSAPEYPVMATGGFIDIDRDGIVGIGDVVSDINLTTLSGNVVTVATTLASNPKTKIELDKMARSLNITAEDILNKTPSESKEIEAISNIMYKYMKENNITDLLDVQDQKLIDLNISAEVEAEYAFYVSDTNHDFKKNEKDLMDDLERNYPDSVNHLETDIEVSDELTKHDDNHLDLADIKDELLTLKSEYESEHGDLDYKDEGRDEVHNQGLACASCHSIGGSATLAPSRSDENENDDEDSENEGSENENEDAENVFDSGATIFTTIDGANKSAVKAASNYSLRLVLESGTIEGYKIGRGTGNVHASFNAGIANYTAEVLDRTGKVVNSSSTNSHDASRLDCNSCHTAAGANGAPGRIVSFNYVTPVVTQPDTNTTTPTTPPTDTNTTTPTTPTTTVSFASDVLPILTSNCASCHGSRGNFSITRSSTAYAGVTPFVNTTTATASGLLKKASRSNGTRHGGGTIFATTSPEYATLRDWINEGALNN